MIVPITAISSVPQNVETFCISLSLSYREDAEKGNFKAIISNIFLLKLGVFIRKLKDQVPLMSEIRTSRRDKTQHR